MPPSSASPTSIQAPEVPFISILANSHSDSHPHPGLIHGSLGLFLALLFIVLTLVVLIAIVLWRIHFRHPQGTTREYSVSADRAVREALNRPSQESCLNTQEKTPKKKKKNEKGKERNRLRKLVLPTFFPLPDSDPASGSSNYRSIGAGSFFNYLKFRPRLFSSGSESYSSPPTYYHEQQQHHIPLSRTPARTPSQTRSPITLTLHPLNTPLQIHSEEIIIPCGPTQNLTRAPSTPTQSLDPNLPWIVLSTCSPTISAARPLEMPPGWVASPSTDLLQVPGPCSSAPVIRQQPSPASPSPSESSSSPETQTPNEPNPPPSSTSSPSPRPAVRPTPPPRHPSLSPSLSHPSPSPVKLELVSNQTGKPFSLNVAPTIKKSEFINLSMKRGKGRERVKAKGSGHARTPSVHEKENFCFPAASPETGAGGDSNGSATGSESALGFGFGTARKGMGLVISVRN